MSVSIRSLCAWMKCLSYLAHTVVELLCQPPQLFSECSEFLNTDGQIFGWEQRSFSRFFGGYFPEHCGFPS
jgi:hypothetical protein